MGKIDELIETDAENVSNSRRALIGFHPDLSAALDTAAEMFRTFSRCMEGVLDDSADADLLAETAERRAVDLNTLIQQFQGNARTTSTPDGLGAALCRVFARRARATIFLLLERYYMWAVTDLLRLRLTPAIGYLRLEAESLALLILMRNDPSLGNRWIHLKIDREGIRFYKGQQGAILRVLQQYDLRGAYEMGSGLALHVRFASAARGLAPKRKPNEIQLNYQEIREEDPSSYFLQVLYVLRTQERIFRALGDAFPEVSDPFWFERVRIFSQTVEFLWQHFERVYPEKAEKYKQMLQQSKGPNSFPRC